MLFLRGDVRCEETFLVLRILGSQTLPLAGCEVPVAAVLYRCAVAVYRTYMPWAVVAAWCKTTRHLTGCIFAYPWTVNMLRRRAGMSLSTAALFLRWTCGRHEMSYHLRMS